jgi:hypothetical protein
MIVGLTWSLALSRANLPKEERAPVSIFLDELQDFLALPGGDLSSALAQARGLGVSFCVAHQYRSQLSPEIKAAVDTNCRNKIIFGLGASDAKEMAAMSTTSGKLEAVDFMTLPRYHIYASLQHGGKATGWLSGETLPSPAALRLPVELKALSQARYGRELVDPGFVQTPEPEPLAALTAIGRKKVG